jgi:hypothetical protein
VVKLAGRLDSGLQAVASIYSDRKRHAVDKLLAVYIKVCVVFWGGGAAAHMHVCMRAVCGV